MRLGIGGGYVTVGLLLTSVYLGHVGQGGAVRRLGLRGAGLVKAQCSLGHTTFPTHPGNDASRSFANGNQKLADCHWTCGRGGSTSPDQGTQCHRDNPNGVGVARSQASYGSSRCGSNGGTCDIDFGTCACGNGTWTCCTSECKHGSSSKEDQALGGAGSSGRHRGGSEVEGGAGEVLQQPPGGHGGRTATGGGANGPAGGCDGGNGRWGPE